MSLFEYAPAPESRSAVDIAPSYGLFIDGEFEKPGEVLETVNPATEEILAEVTLASSEDVDRAVAAGWKAFPAWGRTSAAERAVILNKIADRMEEGGLPPHRGRSPGEVARRLSTVMERLLDEVSFDAARLEGQTVTIDAAFVDRRLAELSRNEDLSRYIL